MICTLTSLAVSIEAKTAIGSVQYKKYTPNEFTIIHVLTVNPNTTKIIATRAKDTGHSIATVGSIAQHHNALAAINGGFFRLNEQSTSNWVPAGALKINNQWHGIAYKSRGAIGWDPANGKVLFDIIQTKSNVRIEQLDMPVNAMNKLVSGRRTALFSDSYTDAINIVDRTAIIISDRRIQAVYKTGDVTVPANTYMFIGNFNTIVPGNSASVSINAEPQLEKSTSRSWNSMPFIVSGGPLLIHKKNKISNFKNEHLHTNFINERYARTAVGLLPNGNWVLVVAERSFLSETQGLSIPELRDFMYSIGCVEAVNLDGGGSSAMYLQGNKDLTANDRPVVDALLVFAKS
jgi:exopolysaccharide biosynthesis protein